jgi:uncharacterized protein
MRILLPPSEGKAPKGRGRSLAARAAATAAAGADEGADEGPLAEARLTVLRAVSAWCASDPAQAALGLGLPATTAKADLQVNVDALEAKTMPAIERFRGVVFEGLDWTSMSAGQRRVVNRTILIASGGFGLLQASEPIPDHRIPMAATVPGIGGLTPYWRRHLEGVIPAFVGSRHLVIDLRSTDYSATPPVPASARRQVLAVKVLTERIVAGQRTRTVVSYSSKLVKGQLARALVSAEAAGTKLRKPTEVAAVAEEAGFRSELGTAANGQPTLDIILTAEPG